MMTCAPAQSKQTSCICCRSCAISGPPASLLTLCSDIIFDKKAGGAGPGGSGGSGSGVVASAWGGVAAARPHNVPRLRDVMSLEECAADLEGGAPDDPDIAELLRAAQKHHQSVAAASASASAGVLGVPQHHRRGMSSGGGAGAPVAPEALEMGEVGRQPGAGVSAAAHGAGGMFWDYGLTGAPSPPAAAAAAPQPQPQLLAPAPSQAKAARAAAAPQPTLASRLAAAATAAVAGPSLMVPTATAVAAAATKQAQPGRPGPLSQQQLQRGHLSPAALSMASTAVDVAPTNGAFSSAGGVAVAAPSSAGFSDDFWSWCRTAWAGFGQSDIGLLEWLTTLNCRSEIADYINQVEDGRGLSAGRCVVVYLVLGWLAFNACWLLAAHNVAWGHTQAQVIGRQPGAGAFVAEFLKRKDAEAARLANPGKAAKKKGAGQAATADWAKAAAPTATGGGKKAGKAAGGGSSGGKQGAGRANGFAVLGMQ
jgi:hypothetical protein